MASFTACFDASGQEHEHGYVVVAGFVSTAEEWISFSEKWNETLKRYGLTEFHANHCQNYKGEFKDWKGDDAKRIQLWCDLLQIIKSTAFQKFASGIVIEDWQSKVSQKTKLKWKMNAYALCAILCAERVREWARRNAICTPLRYVYESGDPKSGVIIEHFKRDGFPFPNFENKYDKIVDGVLQPAFIPLQAADFLAYEIFLTKKILAKKAKPALSRPIHAFQEMPEQLRIFKGKKLDDLENDFKKFVKVRDLWRIF